MKRMNVVPALTMLAISVLAGAPPRASAQPPYEEPPTFRAADRAPAELLTGPHHRVDERVVNDGFMNHFTVHSDFGDFEASSERMLAVRVREVAAIAKLRELSKTDAFSSALKKAATAPVDAVKQVVDEPVETVKGIPGGVTRKARGLYYKGRKMTHDVKTEVDEEKTEDGTKGAGGEESDSDQAKSAAKSAVGYSSAYRELARSLQVDPYTTNPVLQAELKRLASAAFAAGLGFKMVVPVGGAIGLVTDVAGMVWNTPPEELERLNNLALRDMGIDKDTRLRFFASDALTTTTQTLIVEQLKRLAPLAGRGSFIELALQAEDEGDAWLIAQSALLLASYHAEEAPIAKLVVAGNDQLGRAVVGVTADDQAIVPLAFDHVTWQAGMDQEGPLARMKGRQLWLGGTISPRAQEQLQKRGFAIHTRALAHFESRGGGNP